MDHRHCLRGPVAGLVALFLLASASPSDGQVLSGEQVLLFPTAARLDGAGQTWLVPVHGWVFEPDRNFIVRRVALHQLSKEMDLEDDTRARRMLAERARWVLASSKHERRIEITIGDRQFGLTPSSEDGHFEDLLEVPAELVSRVADEGRLRLDVRLPDDDQRTICGTAMLVPQTGLTVISDIDDTVKVTEVTQHIRLLRRTFVEPFQAVAGMADLYQAWSANGALIWYVSAGPWHFYVPVQEFLADAGFPPAVWDMRRANLLNAGARELFDEQYEYKLAQLTGIVNAFPDRRYVLIGDSGEKDPETYGEIARRFPDQVVSIAIRDVTGQTADAKRYRSVFREVPPERWQVFRDPAELVTLLPD